ncbi:MAG TPA: type 4 pilus major pilin [Noviherbaspirillum sp.]|nr:type 4 pilus major pilin [Noviherbaspirillum sp.]
MSEILGTLFKYLVSLLGVGAVVLILYQVFGANKAQTALSDLTILQTNAQTLYSGQSTFTSLTNTVAINGKLAPDSMIQGGALQNPWGGAITVKVSANAGQFDVTEPAVPSKDCATMATSMNSVVGLKINGTAQTLPMEAGAAVNACNVTTAAGNTMIFTFSH